MKKLFAVLLLGVGALLHAPSHAAEIRSQRESSPYASSASGSQRYSIPPSKQTLEIPTIEVPAALELPPVVVGCWHGEDVLDDVTVVLGDHGADSYTSTIYTLCYRKRGDGPYELSLATATAGSTNPWAGLGGFLLASRIAAVEAQFSDEKLELVPEDEPTRFRLHISFRMTTHLSLFGMYVGQSSYNCDELMYCQVRSPSSVYCQSAGTTERDDGTWKVLGHGHVELTRLANQAS